MNRKQACPSDVLREFIADIRSAYATGDGNALDRMRLRDDWPDLLATYDHAVACLSTPSRLPEPDDGSFWQCPDCDRTLPTAEWTYSFLADAGSPICDDCVLDMKLFESADSSGALHNAWIIVDAVERRIVLQVYEDYAECIHNACRIDNALVVGLTLSDRATNEDGGEEERDG